MSSDCAMWRNIRGCAIFFRAAFVVLVGVVLVVPLTGCSAYRLEGMVIDGPTPSLSVVDAFEARHEQLAMRDVVVSVTIDPSSLGAKQLPAVRTDEHGRFSVGIDEVGAGVFAEYEIELFAQAAGHRSFADRLKLPMRGKKLLVVMRIGRDTGAGSTDILRETLDWKKQMDE